MMAILLVLRSLTRLLALAERFRRFRRGYRQNSPYLLDNCRDAVGITPKGNIASPRVEQAEDANVLNFKPEFTLNVKEKGPRWRPLLGGVCG